MTPNPSQLNQTLRTILEPQGFEQDPDVVAAIGYRGRMEGRVLRISAAVRGRNQFTGVGNASFRVNTGLAISVTADTEIATRFTLGTAPLGWLATRVYFPRLGMKRVSAAVGLDVWASEEAWAQQFMATEAFRAFASAGSELSVTALVFTPETISLTCFPRNDQLESATVTRWLRLAADLATAAEAQPPKHRAQHTWLERQPRGTRVAILVDVLFGVPLLLLGIFAGCLIAVLAILTALF